MRIIIIDEQELVIRDDLTIDNVDGQHVIDYERILWPADRVIVSIGNDFKIIKDKEQELIGLTLTAQEVMAYI